MVQWLPPPADWIKVNVAGSCFEASHRIGLGGILRNDRGSWISGFSCFAGRGGILLAELMAIRKGLHFAWDLGFKKIICESDSEEAVRFANLLVTPPQTHIYDSVINDVRNMLSREWEVNIVHVMREANASANVLAKWGAHDEIEHVWSSPPAPIQFGMMTDALGSVHLG